MVTNPDDGIEHESFAEAFPDFVREVITGNESGELRVVVLLIVAALCLVTAPLPFSAIGIVALFMLNLARR